MHRTVLWCCCAVFRLKAAFRAERARYALLYAEVEDRVGLKQAAIHCSYRLGDIIENKPMRCAICAKRFTIWAGANCARATDREPCVCFWARRKNDKFDNPGDLGMLYLSIGDVYRGELNFVRAYRYYGEARELFCARETCVIGSKHCSV